MFTRQFCFCAFVCLPLQRFLRITTIIQLIAITDVRTSITSSISATAAGTTASVAVDQRLLEGVTGTLLEGAAGILSVIETVLIVDLVKCVLDSKRCSPISGTPLTGRVTADDCDDGVNVECVYTCSEAVYEYHCVIRITACILPIGATSTIITTFKCNIEEI